jgi:hypothetical protein
VSLTNKKGAAQMHEETAFLATSFIVAQEELLSQFLSLSGANLPDLKSRLQDPDFLGSILDFILNQDELLLAFCAQSNLTPQNVWKARASFPGMALWEST